MNISKKYGRTYHYPFSPGTTSDDRINSGYWEDMRSINELIHTEKLDGENNCLNRMGVFARSHAAPTTSPWTQFLRDKWAFIKNDLGDIELFGENLYAIHSIEYKELEEYYYIFAVRCMDKWLSWEEVKFYASLFDFPTVPEVCKHLTSAYDQSTLSEQVIKWASEPSVFGSFDTVTEQACSREGIVSRNTGEFNTDEFPNQVFKYVRKGHVKTDQHWTRNWKRAKLLWEFKMTDSFQNKKQ